MIPAMRTTSLLAAIRVMMGLARTPGSRGRARESSRGGRNVYVAEAVNGHDTSPAFTQSVATDHVIHSGTISTGGLTGNADRSLGDFFQIAIDPTNHQVNIAFDDDHVTPGRRYRCLRARRKPSRISPPRASVPLADNKAQCIMPGIEVSAGPSPRACIPCTK